MTLLTPAQGRLRAAQGRLRAAQDWLRAAQDWLSLAQSRSVLLTLGTISGRLRRSIHNRFNSSRASLELVPYIKITTIVPVFRKQMVPPSLSFYLDILHLSTANCNTLFCYSILLNFLLAFTKCKIWSLNQRRSN